MPNTFDSLSLSIEYDKSLTRKDHQHRETTEETVLWCTHTLSEQPQSGTAVDKWDDYPVLCHEEAVAFVDFRSAILENCNHPRGNPTAVLWPWTDREHRTPSLLWHLIHQSQIFLRFRKNRTMMTVSTFLRQKHLR